MQFHLQIKRPFLAAKDLCSEILRSTTVLNIYARILAIVNRKGNAFKIILEVGGCSIK